ncbi:MAG: hypothetical protein OEV42_17175 [Deltaproteobacteria bacterium]|nr:hypothetical protein [Deltaproteobacteria bacterium]
MKGRYFFCFTALLALLITGVAWPGAVRAVEAVSITHTVKSYVSDGSAMVVTLNLQVQNNSGSVMNNVAVRPTPMPKELLFTGAAHVEPISMGSIPVGANASADYTITSHMILPQDVIAATPIFWEVRYLDGAGQEKGAIAVSGISTEGSGL